MPAAGGRHRAATCSATCYYMAVDDAGGTGSLPSVADVGYLGIYPFLLAGLLLALREHLRGVRLIVVLDGLARHARGRRP